MKISYESHPALEILHNKVYSKVKLLPKSNVKKPADCIHRVVKDGIGKTYYPTKTFDNAFNVAMPKFRDVNLFNDLPSQTSLVCFGEFVIGVKIEKSLDLNHTFHYCLFTGNYLLGGGTYMIDCSKHGVSAEMLSENEVDDLIGASDSIKNIGGVKQYLFMTLLFLLFVKYAEIQIKTLPPKSKSSLFLCNYQNSTKSIVTIINCTWFTTLVKSEGFKVRGHFRLQPKKKEGEWTKELIWITDFEKTGYTAPARKLSATI